MLKQKINPMSAETEKTSLTAEASQKPPEQAPKEGEAEEEEQSECAACCQNNIAKILFLFLIIIYTWSAEEVFIFTRTTKIAIIMDRLKGGERERFMVNLANRFVNTRTLHCYFLTNQPEKFEYTLDPKVGRVNVFKGKNRDWSFINKFIRENEIKMIFYNGYDANEMKALQSFGKPVVFFNHDTYFTQLAYNHNLDYFKFFNRSKGVVNFIPPEIKHFQEYGHKNVISMHKPIAYDFFDVKPAKLIGKRIILFGTSNYKELMKKTFEKGLKIFAKILEKDPEARLYVIADFSGYTNIVPLSKLIFDLNLKDKVEPIENLTEANLELMYQNASLAIFPSPMEAISSFLLEAKTFGIPTIVAGNEYLQEEYEEGSLWFKDEDIDGMALEGVKILSDWEYRRKLGKRARESMRYYQNGHWVRNWVYTLWGVSSGGLPRYIRKQARIFDKLEEKNHFIMRGEDNIRYEFEDFKQTNWTRFKCLEWEDGLAPLLGKGLKACK